MRIFGRNLGSITEGLRNFVQTRNHEAELAELSEITTSNSKVDQPKNIFEMETSKCRCSTIEDFFAFLETSEIKAQIINNESVLMLTVDIVETLNEISGGDLNELNCLFREKSAVVLFKAVKDFKRFVYWKSKEISNFVTVSHYKEDFGCEDRDVYQFIADFLGESLKKGELGFCKRFSFNQNLTKVEVPVFADYRNYNLLLLAAEVGNVIVVDNFLKIGLSEETFDKVTNAQLLAWQGTHSDVLVVLAEHDLTYPDGIDINQLSNTFKAFYKRIEEFHAAIISKDVEKVKKVIFNNDNKLKYFFNIDNSSAASIAIQAKAFEIYEILLANEITLLQHEKIILKKLTKQEQRQVREIHTKYSKDLKDKHINILMAHSYAGHNTNEPQEKLKLIKKAYETLSQDSRLNAILKVVATSRKLKIVYDFNNESVDTVDPTSSAYTEGIFYPTGRIYIGAKQLLNEDTKYKTLSTIVHELGHYAMNLTYENNAKPYRGKDSKDFIEFCKVFNDCTVNAPIEPFIHLVYEAYSKEYQHAELIVRVPHLIALYFNQPEKLKEIIKLFPKLFEYYDKKVIPNMMKVMPEIEDRIEKRMEELFEEKKFLKIFSFGMFVMMIATSIFAVNLVQKSPKIVYKYNTYTETETYPFYFTATVTYTETVQQLCTDSVNLNNRFKNKHSLGDIVRPALWRPEPREQNLPNNFQNHVQLQPSLSTPQIPGCYPNCDNRYNSYYG